MRSLYGFQGLSFLLSLAAFARKAIAASTITGTISDPAGGVVANAAIQARNVDTGARCTPWRVRPRATIPSRKCPRVTTSSTWSHRSRLQEIRPPKD